MDTWMPEFTFYLLFFVPGLSPLRLFKFSCPPRDWNLNLYYWNANEPWPSSYLAGTTWKKQKSIPGWALSCELKKTLHMYTHVNFWWVSIFDPRWRTSALPFALGDAWPKSPNPRSLGLGVGERPISQRSLEATWHHWISALIHKSETRTDDIADKSARWSRCLGGLRSTLD